MKTFVRKSTQLAILATALLGGAAFADKPADPAPCTFSDLTNVVVTACAGFTDNNHIKGSSDSTAAALLGTLGLLSDGHAIDLASKSGSTLTFTTALYGWTIIGLHIGGGDDGHVANSTAFYKFDAGSTGIHTINTTFSSLSNGGLYVTSAVPEPATYGMLLAGLGLVGALRRRRQS